MLDAPACLAYGAAIGPCARPAFAVPLLASLASIFFPWFFLEDLRIASAAVLVKCLTALAVAAQAGQCPCPEGANEEPSRLSRSAIVILSERSHLLALDHTLRLLYRNFNRCFRKDVLIFHHGGLTSADQDWLRRSRGSEIQFHTLRWGGPFWRYPARVQAQAHRLKLRRPEGYYHMTRWFGVLIYEYLARLGYDWYMRLDDDSLLLSCIGYDVFESMERRNISYAYRMKFRSGAIGTLPQRIPSWMRSQGMEVPQRVAARFPGGGPLTEQGWDRGVYYNNFHMVRLASFTSPAVRDWLQHVDDLGLMYFNYVQDAELQTMTVLMHLPEEAVHRFSDWSYCHFPLMAFSIRSLLPLSLRRMLPAADALDRERTVGIDDGYLVELFLVTVSVPVWGWLKRSVIAL